LIPGTLIQKFQDIQGCQSSVQSILLTRACLMNFGAYVIEG
jgi:hypothetical protein